MLWQKNWVQLEFYSYMIHKTVLLHESIDGLDIHSGDIYLDGTLGGAGHAEYALNKVQGNITIIGLDRDTDAIERSRKRLENIVDSKKVFLIQSNYSEMDKAMDSIGIHKVNRIMLDLGLSSDQFEISGRGFTFKNDEPLLMTFKKDLNENDLTAYQIVNNWQEESIADIIYGYGEEKYARRIARGIINYRSKKSIDTTNELVEIINQSVPFFYKRGRIHPATRTFQALRITVNDELNSLKKGLEIGFERLMNKGRMAVISFHSLEDRIVKNFNKEKENADLAIIHTRKPIVPSESEISENPRSRSAKLRILEKK